MILLKKKKEEDINNWGIPESVADLEKLMLAYNIPHISTVEDELRLEIRKFLNSNSNSHDLLSSPLWLNGWIREWLDLMLEELVLNKIDNETLFLDRSKTNELQLQQVIDDLLFIDEEIQNLEAIVNKTEGGR